MSQLFNTISDSWPYILSIQLRMTELFFFEVCTCNLLSISVPSARCTYLLSEVFGQALCGVRVPVSQLLPLFSKQEVLFVWGMYLTGLHKHKGHAMGQPLVTISLPHKPLLQTLLYILQCLFTVIHTQATCTYAYLSE